MERLARKAPSLSMIPKIHTGRKEEPVPTSCPLTNHALWHDCAHIYIDEHNKEEHKINSQLSSWRGSMNSNATPEGGVVFHQKPPADADQRQIDACFAGLFYPQHNKKTAHAYDPLRKQRLQAGPAWTTE